jgi:hypothetical protein
MPRPVKWSRDLHLLRERAAHSRTETWSRQDLERLFNIGRASTQSLMKAIGLRSREAPPSPSWRAWLSLPRHSRTISTRS